MLHLEQWGFPGRPEGLCTLFSDMFTR